MKRILFLVSTLKRSGPINVLIGIIKHLDRNKFIPIVLTLSPESHDSLWDYFKDDLKVEVSSLNLSRLQGLFKSKKLLKRFLDNNSIDLIHSHGIRADSLIYNLNILTVSTLHNYPFEDYSLTYGRFKGFVMALLHLYFLKGINRAFVVSEAISKTLKEKNNYKIDYIRNGTDNKEFTFSNKKYYREKLGLPVSGVIFICVGHLSKRKDPLTVIKAYKKAELNNSLLIFLGDGDLRSKCNDFIGNDESIILKGQVSNVNEYLSASDFFISASIAESFQLTVTEAVFSGLYCYLSDIPVRREMLSMGLSFNVFEVSDYEELSKMISNINLYEKKEIVFNNIDVAKRLLTSKVMSNNYQKVYSKLLGLNNG